MYKGKWNKKKKTTRLFHNLFIDSMEMKCPIDRFTYAHANLTILLIKAFETSIENWSWSTPKKMKICFFNKKANNKRQKPTIVPS